MPPQQPARIIPDVPRKVFEEFLERLRVEDHSQELIERLRAAILESPSLSETALKTALFPEDKTL
jgi:hypothetical protein